MKHLDLLLWKRSFQNVSICLFSRWVDNWQHQFETPCICCFQYIGSGGKPWWVLLNLLTTLCVHAANPKQGEQQGPDGFTPTPPGPHSQCLSFSFSFSLLFFYISYDPCWCKALSLPSFLILALLGSTLAELLGLALVVLDGSLDGILRKQRAMQLDRRQREMLGNVLQKPTRNGEQQDTTIEREEII